MLLTVSNKKVLVRLTGILVNGRKPYKQKREGEEGKRSLFILVVIKKKEKIILLSKYKFFCVIKGLLKVTFHTYLYFK